VGSRVPGLAGFLVRFDSLLRGATFVWGYVQVFL